MLEIESIVFLENRKTQETFEECKKKFKDAGFSEEETLLFHGTDASNVDSIFTNNFDIDYNPIGREKVRVMFIKSDLFFIIL